MEGGWRGDKSYGKREEVVEGKMERGRDTEKEVGKEDERNDSER